MSGYQSIRSEVLIKLERALPYLCETYGVATIGIFGSVAREEDGPDSDVDVLYGFCRGGRSLREFFSFKAYLEDLLGREVDFVLVKWIAPEIRPFIEPDMILYTTGADAA